MKRVLLDTLICPKCLPLERALRCRKMETEGEEILRGRLYCRTCRAAYPIEEGLAVLVSSARPGRPVKPPRYEQSALVSSYLWTHFADLWGDPQAHSAFPTWAGLMAPGLGNCLDAGCAVGRFAFEMTRRADFVVGIDLSRAFVRAARDLMAEGELEFTLPREGLVVDEFRISRDSTWRPDRLEFIVADAQALPFPRGAFSALASLNLVDRVPDPLRHLVEINRVARESGAQFLFSDPFSWSAEIADPMNWLGGTYDGGFPGDGLYNVRKLLTSEERGLGPGWTVQADGSVWWKIRDHRNHFELIRSWYIKASR